MSKPALIEFTHEQALRRAIETANRDGHRIVEIYAPYEVDVEPPDPEALRRHGYAIMRDGVVAGAVAFALVYLLQWWAKDVAFYFPVGGRAEHPWPAFVLPAIEAAMLMSGVAGLASFLVRTGLPFLSNPIFAVDGFERVSQASFALALELAEGAQPADFAAAVDGEILSEPAQ